jgi:periplasmic protein TonB
VCGASARNFFALGNWRRGSKFVSSAANIASQGKTAEEKEGSGTPRPNPVALEVLVNVTGANAGAEDGARHLFSEETSTVLVFKDGAVIRLAAPVAVGQLLFLTSKKSNQEVVCQVLKKKSFKANSSYVELVFTEERTDYWGVAFPEGAKSTPEFIVQEQVQAEETTAEPEETPVEPHSAEDVDALKQEVEALREQLALLEKKNIAEAAEKAMAEAQAAREAAAREMAMREASKAMAALEAQSGHSSHQDAPVGSGSHGSSHAEEEKPALLMPNAPKDTDEVARAVVGMSLPVWKLEKSPEEQLLEEEAASGVKREPEPVAAEVPAEEAAEELLPKPSLDFSQTPKKGKAKGKAAAVKVIPAAAKSGKMSTARVMALSAVLGLALAGGAWYGKWWELLPLGKSAASARPSAIKKPSPAKIAAGGGAGKPAVAGGGAANSAGSAVAAASGKAAKDSAANDAADAEDANDAARPGESESSAGERRAAARERAAARKEAAKAAEQLKSAAADVVPADAPLVAAKLLKAANPVYPPDAMRSYITGDVKAEVVVNASGHVTDVKVISGPKALREAAVTALKEYEYAPATQGGKTVEGKAEEVVKFWFNP